MNLKELRKLITLFEQRNLTELEYEEGGLRVRLRKESSNPQPTQAARVESRPEVVQAGSMPLPAAISHTVSNHLVPLQSPIVGTFYRAPAPDAPPYVELGDTVAKGQVICIVEAMKVMNEIEAECGGLVRSILPENAQPVEYGDTLFLIEPFPQGELTG